MKMYRTSKNNLTITEIEVIRETDSCIWVNDWSNKLRKQFKSSSYNDVFQTWEHAKNHIVNREERKLRWAKESLIRAESDLRKAHELSFGAVEV